MSENQQASRYYVAQKAQLLRELDRFSLAAKEILVSHYGEAATVEKLAEIR